MAGRADGAVGRATVCTFRPCNRPPPRGESLATGADLVNAADLLDPGTGNAQLWETLANLPDAGQRERLEALLVVPFGENTSVLDRLRRGPTSITAFSSV